MTVHLPVYKDAPTDGNDYVRHDGQWKTISATKLQSGFDDRSDSTLSFEDSNRTFTIQPVSSSFDIYQKGKKYTISTTDTIVIDDLEGLHFIYYDDGSLAKTQTFSSAIITEYVFVCAIYWNATDNKSIIVGEERHGWEMDSATHLYLHETVSARYGSGLGISNITSDGTGNDAAHAQFAVGSGDFWDEDIEHTITAGTTQDLAFPAELPVLYKSGATGGWKRLAATTYPITTTGTGRAAYNEWTGSTWQLTEISNTNYMLMHYIATNDINEPVMAIVGTTEYTNVAAAREGAYTEISALTFGGLEPLTPEFVPLGTVIFQTRDTYSNAVKSRIRTTDTGDQYIDWRTATIVGSGGSGDHTHEGTAILSSGETGGTKYLREDGDGTCSWQTVVASGAGAFEADAQTQITPVTSILLDEATGDEAALTINYEVDKATSGQGDGLLMDMTDTTTPAAQDYIIRLKRNGTDRFYVNGFGSGFCSGVFRVGALTVATNTGVYSYTSNSTIKLSGGNTGDAGGNIQLFGQSASPPDDIKLRTDTTDQMHFVAASNQFDFKGNQITTTDEVEAKNFEAKTAHTVAGLPTGSVGMIARVTDASSPTVGNAVTGSGSSAALVWYNGSQWTVIGV